MSLSKSLSKSPWLDSAPSQVTSHAQNQVRLPPSDVLRFLLNSLGPALLRFCTKKERKTSVFVKMFTLIRIKTPQKRRLSKTLSKVDIHKKGRFLKTHLINVNAQRWRFLKTLQYATMSFTKTEQCERTKTDVFRCDFVIGQISVNAQERRFFSPFLYEKGAV